MSINMLYSCELKETDHKETLQISWNTLKEGGCGRVSPDSPSAGCPAGHRQSIWL